MRKPLATLALTAAVMAAGAPFAGASAQDAADGVTPLCLAASGPADGGWVATLPLTVDGNGHAAGVIRLAQPSVHGDQPIVLPVAGTVFEPLVMGAPVPYVAVSGGTVPPSSVVSARMVGPSEGASEGDATVILNGHTIIEDGTVRYCVE